MRKKINSRLIGIALIAILVTLIGVTSIYYYLFENQVRKDLHVLAEVLVDSGVFQKDQLEDVAFTSEDIRVTWIDKDGTVLFDNWNDIQNMENHLERPEIKDAFSLGEGNSIRTSDTMQMNTYYYALRMDDDTVVRVARSVSSGAGIFMNAMPIVFIISVMVTILCVVLADYLTKQLINPIAAIANRLDDTEGSSSGEEIYKELEPFVQTIRSQHENILSAAKMRQDFTASVTHELKTPLTAISGYAELIENRMSTEEQNIIFAGEIRKNANRLLTLINDIIRLSELDHKEMATDFELIDLYALAKECTQNILVNAKRRGIQFILDGQSCMVKGNRHLLCELIENLCENGIRYNNEGGFVRLTIEQKNGSAILVVEDNGIGIPEKHKERVFERFYRVDKSRSKATGGTGLGLAIVKHIVAIHSAKIVLESEVDKGTVITIKF
ncbi:MAG: two-component sensor histidine kinase [Agathobacter sp.]|nr:two-component sensor histidine kinase [Agathobacter sp.]